MTYQKAYDNIVKTIRGVELLIDEVTLEKALEALYKQTPKEITVRYGRYTCPTCKNSVDEHKVIKGEKVRIKYSYCHFCGQALDWTSREAYNDESTN